MPSRFGPLAVFYATGHVYESCFRDANFDRAGAAGRRELFFGRRAPKIRIRAVEQDWKSNGNGCHRKCARFADRVQTGFPLFTSIVYPAHRRSLSTHTCPSVSCSTKSTDEQAKTGARAEVTRFTGFFANTMSAQTMAQSNNWHGGRNGQCWQRSLRFERLQIQSGGEGMVAEQTTSLVRRRADPQRLRPLPSKAHDIVCAYENRRDTT